MADIRIVTDSTTDLPPELLQRYRIEVVPLTVQIDGASYQDGVSIEPEQFLGMMSGARELPKTSQPAAGAFLELYDRLGKEGADVVSIHMSGGLSGTYQSALTAAGMTETNVKVIDSLMISQALGFQVLEAARLAEAGETVDTIDARLDAVRRHSYLYVVVDTLENLIKGGRIGKAAGWIGTVLSIKPVAALREGVYAPIARVRTVSQVVRTLLEHFIQDAGGRPVREIGISHADNLPLAERLRDELGKLTEAPVRIRPATPVITTHTGPGAIGFMFQLES